MTLEHSSELSVKQQEQYENGESVFIVNRFKKGYAEPVETITRTVHDSVAPECFSEITDVINNYDESDPTQS